MRRSRGTLSEIKRAMGVVPSSRTATNSSGDIESLSYLIDLDDLLGNRLRIKFTNRQLTCIQLCLMQGLTELEASVILGVSQQAISYSISLALGKIKRFLSDEEPKPKGCFTKEETSRVIDLYNVGRSDKDIAIELNKSLRTIRNKIRYLREKGEIGVVNKERG